MKNFSKIIIGLSILLILGPSVNAQIFKSKQTKRHKELLLNPDDYKTGSRVAPIEYIVSVQPPAAVQPKAPKTFLDLAPDVQKELIKRLAQLEDTGSAAMDQLKKNFSNKTSTDAPFEVEDLTEAKRQIIVGVFNKSLFPGDRIYRFESTVKTTNQEIYFLSCDAVITKYETLEIAKQTQTSNLGFELNGNVGSTVVTNSTQNGTNTSGSEDGNSSGAEKNTSSQKNTSSNTNTASNSKQSTTGLGASGKFNASRSRAEEGSLRQRYVALSGNVLDKGIKVYTESVSGIDLTGNIIIEATFKFKSTTSDFIYSFTKLYKPTGEAQSPEDVEAKFKFVIYPTLSDDVKMDAVSASGVLRAIAKNRSTIMEGDDQVAMIEYKTLAPVEGDPVLVRKSDVIPKKWVIKTATERLRVRTSAAPANTSGVLYFDNIHQANAFLQWLRDIKSANGISANKPLVLKKAQCVLTVQSNDLFSFLNNCTIEIE